VGRTNTIFQTDLSDAVVTILSITSEGNGFVSQRAETRFVLDLIKVIRPRDRVQTIKFHMISIFKYLWELVADCLILP